MDYLLYFLLSLTSVFWITGADEPIKAAEGEHCVLPCFIDTTAVILHLEWTHVELNKRLLVFRGESVQDGYEHPNYTNRVELQEPQLLRGNLSVVLKNVTVEENGTYRCLVVYNEDQKRSQFIRLNVKQSPAAQQQDTTNIRTTTEPTQRQFYGLISGLVTVAVLVVLLAVVIFLLYKRRATRQQETAKSPFPDSEKGHETLKDPNPSCELNNSPLSSSESLDSPSPISSISSNESESSTTALLRSTRGESSC